MSNSLVIVESPAKAKTIKKYLGKGFEVLASYGHVRDLVPKEGAVNPDRNFEMRYALIERNERHVDAIERAMKKADSLYLATDPDREGEAISWHLHEILKERGVLKDKHVHRAKFFEITKNEVQKAIDTPERLSKELVSAQQARRALDYLVGFNLSPLLWKKIMPGLSAGRVQSVALRLICEREAEIAAFVRQEYWTVEIDAAKDGQPFKARVVEVDGERFEADVGKGRFSITNEAAARALEARLKAAAQGKLAVAGVESKPRSRSPQAPFRTSTLQQAAANRLGFSARRTMQLAQKLYEGVDFGEGPVGLITYMRTDSTSLSAEAIGQIRETARTLYGAESLPEQPRSYANKQKNAQEAHEGIRPTSSANTPEKLRGHIDDDQWRLYSLIWKRTIASQMANALFEQVTVTLHPGAHPAAGTPVGTIRASGSTLIKPGYLAAYEVDRNDEDEAEDGGGRLPAFAAGDVTELVELRPEQHFTEPPPRYTEAGLVKALEERGIGRPSTYAAIIETLRARKYVEDERRNFVPTDTGKIVSGFLVKFFPQYVDYEFTARLEDDLDDISRGDKEWVPVMRQFWRPFIERVKDIEANVTREQVAQARPLGIDPVSGRPISVRIGQYGPFAQLGTKDDVEKPRFAGLRPGQKMDSITLEDALKLFTLPRKLGDLPGGEHVAVGIGRFGPYVKYGHKYVSIKVDDPYAIQFPRALELIEEKRVHDAARLIKDYGVDNMQVLNGRFGPYLTDHKRNARIPKDREPASLTLEEAKALLADAPLRGTSRFGRRKAVAKPAAPAPVAPAASATAAPAPARKAKPAAKPAKAAAPPAAKPHAAKTAKPAKAAPRKAAKLPTKPARKSRRRRRGRSAIGDNFRRTPDIPAVREYLLGLQERITSTIETADGGASFRRDPWQRPGGGGGETRVLAGGRLLEQGGVGFSHVAGAKLPGTASGIRPEIADAAFEALGVSLVFHPQNPYVPAVHLNVRFFIASKPGQAPLWWFGGGMDLTPTYGFDEDVLHWHRVAKQVCDSFGEGVYARAKDFCDKYFFLPHRGETRGVGGIFFDDMNLPDFERCFAFQRAVGDAFLEGWLPIAERRRHTPFGERERSFQLYRRGRYVEFNLLFDRGTAFGLQSAGRVESILMSMPPLARWQYGFLPEPGSAEEALTAQYLRPRDWLKELGG